MFQPFLEFKETYIDRLKSLHKNILVTQTYHRYTDPLSLVPKTAILVTDYDNRGLANIHLKAVLHDKYGAIVLLDNEKHLQQFLQLLQPGSPYKVFWSVVNNLNQMEERLKKKYSKNLMRYVAKTTDWHIARDENLTVSFQVTYGELYIIIRRKTQTIRVKFDEIEKS